MPQTNKFTVGFYFKSLTKMLGAPRKFFSQLPQEIGLRQSVGFLLVSSLFFTGASLVQNIYPNPGVMGCIFLVNAIGMVLIAAGLGYLVMALTIGKQVSFTRFFSVYAFSSGVTLLASWIPFFIWITEPWKWWLIGIGMVNHCGFKRRQAVIIIVLTLAIIILSFWSAFPVIRFLKTKL